jgi:hypothetical protein
MPKRPSDRSAERLRRDAELLRAAAGHLPPGRMRSSLLYGALYAESSAARREAAEGILSAAAIEIVTRFPRH